MMKSLAAALPAVGVLAAVSPASAQEEPPTMGSEVIASYVISEANQAVGVDAVHFYAIDNSTIAKYSQATQELVHRFEIPEGGPVKHFDSAAVMDGKIYVAHSNYPDWPMTSSLEAFDAATLDHLESTLSAFSSAPSPGRIETQTDGGGRASLTTTGFSTEARSFTATSTIPKWCGSTAAGGSPRPGSSRTK